MDFLAGIDAFVKGGVGGTEVRVEIEDDWDRGDDIKTITLRDGDQFGNFSTGEELHTIKDDPPPLIVVTLTIDIIGDGIGEASGGPATANLGIGTGPLASVSTQGLYGAAIETRLVDAFNSAYPGQYLAHLISGQIVVQNVPCPLGAAFGSDDNGLSYSLTMTRTTPFVAPGLSEWGLIVFGLLLLAVGFVAIRRSGLSRMEAP